ncbi:phosphatase PAP2 family protein [Shewanella fidelis]|uniref:undecaprenyl-diphosphate phosphatase n=1 Tax=Shewanella fidelis TaxID=173509 RepID=A0AAW8NRG1_9GAMM|nr:phosphatase PAP2 family protein [Shewanella fidelis]MDR8525312.1 phosphatase PAP2 family protein [Shewanella fidelis]MDW4813651.1 phosphatase PAP2 family protein [Shewanella fidelis]MDW4817691.1 phosphatase PAP2 family protein [Shewanella fidelis]MDW4821758.1 phosphatase PAP2 family protein [Shewanella fidelis]MDW4825979.1 phosphatase PAP2 family protein [Shewanella fidelis]
MNKNKLIAAVMVAMTTPAWASNGINESVDDSIVEAGDMLQILIPATGFFAAWMHDDLEGAKQLTYSTLSTQVIVHGVKQAVGRSRPNESSWNSFPSGHTAAAFSGAAFLQSRYGAKWGVPAYAAATFVGASRIHGNRHYAGDVVAGASTAFLMNQLFVSPHKVDGVYFNAQPTADGFAVGVTVTDEVLKTQHKSKAQKIVDLKHKLELGIGTNIADSSAQAGAKDYLVRDELIDEYQPFSYVNYQYQLGGGDLIELEFTPTETRRRGTVAQDFTLDGETFEAGSEVLTAFRHWMLGGNIYKGLQVNDAVKLDVGLGLYLHMIELDVDLDENGGQYASEDHWRAMPAATAKLSWRLTEGFSAITNLQYQGWESDNYLLAEAGVKYEFNDAWEMGFKYSYTETELDNTEFVANYDSQNLVLTFSNRF